MDKYVQLILLALSNVTDYRFDYHLWRESFPNTFDQFDQEV